MNIVITNSKGGVGKTFIATQILPLSLKNISEINIFEIDDNNDTELSTDIINFRHLDTKNVDDILFDVETTELNIIDSGGGNDSKEVVKALASNKINVDYFIVPTVKDFETIKNIEDTIKTIREYYSDVPIYLVLNKVQNKENVKNEFMYLFGSDKYNINGILDKLDVNKIVAIQDYNELDIVKNIHKTTSLDLITKGEKIVKNIDEYKKKWIMEAEEKFQDKKEKSEYYKDKMSHYRLLDSLMDIRDNIQKAFDW